MVQRLINKKIGESKQFRRRNEVMLKQSRHQKATFMLECTNQFQMLFAVMIRAVI